MIIEELQPFLKALASETRQKILMLYMNHHHELTVNEIAKLVDIGQSTASEHLSVLKRAGIVLSRKVGKEVYYYPNRENVLNLLQNLNDYLKNCCK